MNSQFDLLAQRYLDGTIEREELAALEAILAADAPARREFLEILNLDSALAEAATAAALESGEWRRLGEDHRPQVEPQPLRNGSERGAIRSSRRWWLVAAALVIGVCGWWQRAMVLPQPAFAKVLDQVGVDSLPVGTELRAETHHMESGTMAMRTQRGVRVAVEAPAEFRFESAQRLHLIRGRAAAEVPPEGRGFTIITPAGDAIDLGTRFGVDASSPAGVEVHVFQGEVLTGATGAKRRQSLHTGDAVLIEQGATVARELRSSAFIQADELAELRAGFVESPRVRSEAALAALRQEAALIAMLDFEDGASQPGVYRSVQGRWPGSRAVEFVDVGDHLKLDVGGDRGWPQLTLAAWVRLDRLGAPYQSLLHTDGWNRNNFGQVHWMVTRLSTMRLALFGNTLAPGADEQHGFPDSRTSVLPEQGRWVHLATVYDAEARTVRFYLNGRFDKQTQQAVAHPAQLGPAQIGNWDASDRKLSGRIDELILLGRAMNDDEVQKLFEAGNPYRRTSEQGAARQ